jgi:hypothetical protein
MGGLVVLAIRTPVLVIVDVSNMPCGTQRASVAIVTANIVPSPPILVTLKMEAIRFPEISVLTIATRRHITEDDIRYSHHRLVRPRRLPVP